MPLRQISYRGKIIKFRNVGTLSRRLGISADQANALINQQNIDKIFVSTAGDVYKFKVNDNPLFLEDFGIRRISNRKLLQPSYTIKKNIISNEIENDFVKLIIAISFSVRISVQREERRKRFNVNTMSDRQSIEQAIEQAVYDYVATIDPLLANPNNIEIYFDTMEIMSQYSQQSLELIDNKLREAVPLELFYENIDTEKYKDCVRDYLLKKYKKISRKKIKALGNKEGVSTRELKEFCKDYKIKLIAYNVDGRVITKYIPPNHNKNKTSSHPNLIFIAHNNHLYPLKNKYLHSLKRASNIKPVENATKAFIEFINNNIEPTNIKTLSSLDVDSNDIIKSFQVKDTIYVKNDEYFKCRDILRSFGIEEKIHPFISLKNIGSIIENLYSCNYAGGSINSFFPQSKKFIKGGFNYNSIRESYENVKTIDKNKCYSYCLKSLPFLISLDYRQSKIITHNKKLTYKDIVKHHLYIVKPKKSSILIPDTNAYSGDHLLFCIQQGLEIYCLEEITAKRNNNYLSQFIHDIYQKVNNDDAKFILNVFIGKFESDTEERTFSSSQLCNEEEAKTQSGFITPIENTDYFIVENEEVQYNIYNRKPISIQIKDYSRVVLYNKMIELGIKQKDIVKIKTDSISFVDKNNVMKKINLNTSYTGWKEEEFEPPKNDKQSIYDNNDMTFKLDKSITKGQKTKYYNCYAGVGKTYHIINKLIPKLKDYIVLTPSHSTLLEYRNNNYNCDVIQKYEFTNTLPKEKNIIVDEVFLCGKKGHDIIYKCILDNRNVYIYGDDKQLLPPRENEQFDDKYFYKAFYKKHNKLHTNRRNKFTIDYYNKLINDKYDNYEEVKKHEESDYTKAETIICYRNITREKYNNLMLEKLGFKDMFQVGVKVICKTNDLRQKDIYNNFEFVITDKKFNEGYHYVLNNKITITHKQLEKYFVPAYAKTAYGVQGHSLKSYHYAKEDKYFLKDNNRLSYTIISRIKNK